MWSQMEQVDLKIDWATHEAAKYAVMKWHYSKVMPMGKIIKIGVWEDKKFIGVVLFSRGATPNLGKPYNLDQTQCVELTRVALTKHVSNVSEIVSKSIKMLKKTNPGIKLIVSFADKSQGHHGGIYQAGNWVYTGTGSSAFFYRINGKLTHPRSIGAKGLPQNLEGAKKINKNAERVEIPGKHRYLMPLNKKTRRQILKLNKPYPKSVKSIEDDALSFQDKEGGSIPTLTLQK